MRIGTVRLGCGRVPPDESSQKTPLKPNLRLRNRAPALSRFFTPNPPNPERPSPPPPEPVRSPAESYLPSLPLAVCRVSPIKSNTACPSLAPPTSRGCVKSPCKSSFGFLCAATPGTPHLSFIFSPATSGYSPLLLVSLPRGNASVTAPVSRDATLCKLCRNETSSIQYGTSWVKSGNKTAAPCMNFENLCTSVKHPDSIK
mmetsp:Transcript_9765/g.36232  ORF Transcript_9765/g.36232 Transcript_9765/m.36232 type:complete len:201 (+) Transcript_9765:798-1400(+)